MAQAHQQSIEMLKHIQLPENRRDLGWEKKFLELAPHAYFTMLSDKPETGPDNFPYLMVEIKPDSKEPCQNVIEWLSQRGIGLVVNPMKSYPDYIFSWGMIWNFKERGQFLTDAPVQAEKTFVLEEGQKILAGPPHPQYLPDYVRNLLRQFWIEQGVLAPRILVVGNKDNQFDLCFSLESLGNPPAHEHEGILKMLSWFMPPHYSLALVSEKGLPAFISL